MDSFELNKIIGAILGTLLFVMGVGFLAEGIYAPSATGPSYDLPEPAAASATAAAAAPAVPLPELLAKADPTQGEASAKKCQSCHDFTDGGPNKIGPNLYGVVGRKVASHPGFDYSDALKKYAADTWTYDELNTWLTSPSHMAPGTKMTFVGISDDGERADVLAYLRTLSKDPVPFPAAAAAPAAKAGATPASGAAPAAAATPAAGAAAPATTPVPAATPAEGATTTNSTPATTTAPTSGTTKPAPSAATPTPAPGTTDTPPNPTPASTPAGSGAVAPAAKTP